MREGFLFGLIIMATMLATWGSMIIFNRFARPQPKRSIPVLEYDANNEPISFDLNHKDWDAPEWEAPEWTFDRAYMRSFEPKPQQMLVLNNVLNANEIRTMNMQHILTEINSGGVMILPDEVKILAYSDIVKKPEHQSHDDGCQLCNILYRNNYLKHKVNDDDAYNDVIRSFGDDRIVRRYNKREYSQYKRDEIIKLPPPQTHTIKH